MILSSPAKSCENISPVHTQYTTNGAERKRNGKESVILTLLEKKTQNYIAIRIPGKTSEAVNAAMERLHEEFGEKFSQVFKTITVDNGAEFADFAQIEQYGTKVYFAHPYTSWERAQNERHNG